MQVARFSSEASMRPWYSLGLLSSYCLFGSGGGSFSEILTMTEHWDDCDL